MSEPAITLCMIVRNEEQDLPRCLASVRGIVDEIIVVDTGSTDGTVAVAESFGARVLHYAWTDNFAAARNVGVDAATTEWVLVLDADEELHPEDRHRLREICRDPEVEAYSMLHVNLMDAGGFTETENSYDVTLWRHRPEYRYEGKLHEQIVTAIWREKPDARVDYCQIRILHYGYLKEAVRAKGKSERNLKLARQLVADHPDDVFYLFNLGLELQRLPDLEGAVSEYERVRSGLSWYPLWAAKMFKCLATCLVVLRRWEDATAVIRQGLSIYPDFTDLVYLLGYAAQEQGRHARAVGLFHRCVAMGPATAAGAWPGMAGHRAYEAMARSYVALGRLEDAADAYEAAFAAQPDWTAPLAGMVEALNGHLPDDALLARLAAWFDLEQTAHRVRVADVLLAGGRPDLALQTLTPDLDDDPAARYLRGLALLRLGRHGPAAEALTGVPAALGLPGRGALLAATGSHRGLPAVAALARERGMNAPDLAEAARVCLKEARFWEQAAKTGGVRFG
ncbi:MAG TPA: glycosyltransferase [Symbiobacteriaceae bacterium]|jgi:glycosyltransferase involved in cell wall biosynthesis